MSVPHGIVEPPDLRLRLCGCEYRHLRRGADCSISSLLDPLWQAARTNQLQVVSSELTWLETLTAPLRDGNTTLEALFRAFLTAPEVRLVPATLLLWESAARLRSLGLRTPDALHAATALATGCSLMLTNDSGFRRVPGLSVVLLSDLVADP